MYLYDCKEYLVIFPSAGAFTFTLLHCGEKFGAPYQFNPSDFRRRVLYPATGSTNRDADDASRIGVEIYGG